MPVDGQEALGSAPNRMSDGRMEISGFEDACTVLGRESVGNTINIR